MPTKHKEQVEYVGFDWQNEPVRIRTALSLNEKYIVDALGLYKEFELPDGSISLSSRQAAAEIMNEITGIFCRAFAKKHDGGLTVPNKIIPTLLAIGKNPELIFANIIEPTAFAELARTYHGRKEIDVAWINLTENPSSWPAIDLRKVSDTAFALVEELREKVSRGRPPEDMSLYMAAELRRVFLRYNISVARKSIPSSIRSQAEAGPFYKFVELVLAPMNAFLRTQPKEFHPRWISARRIAIEAAKLSRLHEARLRSSPIYLP